VKLSKTTWVALIIGVIAIAVITLGWTFSQENSQNRQLEADLSLAKQKLAGIKLDDLNTQKAQLIEQMVQINAQTENTKTKLSSSKDSIEATDMILANAKNHKVEVVDISSSGLSGDSLSGIKAEKLSIDVQVEGNAQNIANFTISLSQIFPTALVTTVQMDKLSIPEPTPTPTPTPTVTPTPTPTITPTATPEPTSSPTPPASTPTIPPEKDFSAKISLVIYNYKGS
jgi:hypothetical protein